MQSKKNKNDVTRRGFISTSASLATVAGARHVDGQELFTNPRCQRPH